VDLDGDLPRTTRQHMFRQQRSPNIVGKLTHVTGESLCRDHSMRPAHTNPYLLGVESNLCIVAVPEDCQHRHTFGAEELVDVAADGLVDLIG
jgi:hypothetical protein